MVEHIYKGRPVQLAHVLGSEEMPFIPQPTRNPLYGSSTASPWRNCGFINPDNFEE